MTEFEGWRDSQTFLTGSFVPQRKGKYSYSQSIVALNQSFDVFSSDLQAKW